MRTGVRLLDATHEIQRGRDRLRPFSGSSKHQIEYLPNYTAGHEASHGMNKRGRHAQLALAGVITENYLEAERFWE